MSLAKKVVFFLDDIVDRMYVQRRKNSLTRYYKDSQMVRYVEPVLTDEEKKEIDEFFMANLGQKVDYRFHNTYKYYSGKFDVRFMPPAIAMPNLVHYANDMSYINTVNDKNFLPLIAKAAGIKMPTTILSCTHGVFKDGNNKVLTKDEAVEHLLAQDSYIMKPSVDSCGGRGIVIVDKNSDTKINNAQDVLDLFEQMGEHFVCQKLMKNHKSISDIYPHSVNTIRIITYVHKGEVKATKGVLRLGAGGSRVDNVSAGGMYVAVKDNGELYDYASSDECIRNIKEHPDTHVKFEGHVLENYPKVVESAKRMHEMIPQLAWIDWDFALDEDGEPILIEANCVNGGGLEMIQCSTGEGAFGDDTADILQWIREANKLPKSERKKIRIHM